MDIAWHPRALPGRARGTDAVLAVGLTLAFSEPGLDPYHHYSGTAWAAVGVLGGAALAWRRVSPPVVWLIATATGTWLLCTRHGPDWGGLSPLVLIPSALLALYTLASRTTEHGGLLAMAVTLAALEVGLLSHPVRPEAVAVVAALAVCAWMAGEGAAARSRALQAEREARDLRAAARERARIARELHDIVAHHVSVISLQAGTARLLAESGKPPDARLLAGIETASRQAMTELRYALGVLRHTGGAGVGPRGPAEPTEGAGVDRSEPAEHAPGGAGPLPGLDRLDELAAGSGLAVTIDGTAGPLPASIDLAAYRIVQESLTNVLRHSAATAAQVTIRLRDGALHVTVTDDGPARTGQHAGQHAGQRTGQHAGQHAGQRTGQHAGQPVGGGHGLRGLRERVAAHGGTFRAGPRDDGARPGFEVSATLPLLDSPRANGPAAVWTEETGARDERRATGEDGGLKRPAASGASRASRQ